MLSSHGSILTTPWLKEIPKRVYLGRGEKTSGGSLFLAVSVGYIYFDPLRPLNFALGPFLVLVGTILDSSWIPGSLFRNQFALPDHVGFYCWHLYPAHVYIT